MYTHIVFWFSTGLSVKEQTLYYLALISDFETFRTIESRLEEVSEFSTLKPGKWPKRGFFVSFLQYAIFQFY